MVVDRSLPPQSTNHFGTAVYQVGSLHHSSRPSSAIVISSGYSRDTVYDGDELLCEPCKAITAHAQK